MNTYKLFGGWCGSFAARCSLLVVCCLFVIGCYCLLRLVVCCLLSAICNVVCAVRSLLHGGLLFVGCYVVYVVCC